MLLTCIGILKREGNIKCSKFFGLTLWFFLAGKYFCSGHCYDPLCSSDTAFINRHDNENGEVVEIFIDLLLPDEVASCVSLTGNAEIYCELDDIRRLRLLHAPRDQSMLHVDHATFSRDNNVDIAKRKSLYRKKYYQSALQTFPIDAKIQLLSPLYGSISELTEVQISYHCLTFPRFKGHASIANLSFVGGISQLQAFIDCNFSFATNANLQVMPMIVAPEMGPGSYFFTITPLFEFSTEKHEGSSAYERGHLVGYPSFGYVELTLSPQEIRRHRVFAPDTVTDSEIVKGESSMQNIVSLRESAKDNKINICLWGSNSVDGQKTIWFQQIENMDPSLFSFTWILTTNHEDSSEGTVRYRLATAQNVVIIHGPIIKFSRDSLAEDPDDGTPSAADVWEGDEEKLYRYVGERHLRALGNIDALSPPWVRSLHLAMVDYLKAADCGIVVYGNHPTMSSDVVLLNAAKALGLPTVTELLNLFLDPMMVPDAVVAPSTYAAQHPSIAGLFPPSTEEAGDQREAQQARQRMERVATKAGKLNSDASTSSAGHSPTRSRPPMLVVIPPAADLARFTSDGPGSFCDHRNWGDHSPLSDDDTRMSGGNAAEKGVAGSCQCNHTSRQKAATSVAGRHCCSCAADIPVKRVSVGFVARLVPGKNPGLFLMAAHRAITLATSSEPTDCTDPNSPNDTTEPTYHKDPKISDDITNTKGTKDTKNTKAASASADPICRRRRLQFHFTVVGDGPLRAKLEELVIRLEIGAHVTFTGWLGPQALGQVLAGLDIVVNPSLVAVSETFCIANIEAMSMGAALVTFGVGGIGEYVARPTTETSFGRFAQPRSSRIRHPSYRCNLHEDIGIDASSSKCTLMEPERENQAEAEAESQAEFQSEAQREPGTEAETELAINPNAVAAGGRDLELDAEGPQQSFRVHEQYTIISNAVLVNIATPDAIAAAVLALSQNATLRLMIAEAGRQTVENRFNVDRLVHQYSALYRELADR